LVDRFLIFILKDYTIL